VALARAIFGELRGRRVMLIGSGDMAETVARLLQGAGCRIVVVGRNEQRVAELSRAVGGEGRGWHELTASLVEADVVITSTSAPAAVIDRATVARLRKPRRGRSLFFIDLAVPRDIEPRVEELDGVFLYNIDDFSRVVAASLTSREHEAARADQIVDEETRGFERWAEAAQVTPTVLALRARLSQVLRAELERSLRGKLKHLGDGERQVLDKMAEAALNKMLHGPTSRLRQVAADRDESFRLEALVGMLTELFALDEVEPPAEATDSQDEAGAPIATAPRTGTDPG
jgi:glutamyl-tRNA reductase